MTIKFWKLGFEKLFQYTFREKYKIHTFGSGQKPYSNTCKNKMNGVSWRLIYILLFWHLELYYWSSPICFFEGQGIDLFWSHFLIMILLRIKYFLWNLFGGAFRGSFLKIKLIWAENLLGSPLRSFSSKKP